MTELVTIIGLLLLIVVREILHFLQVNKLQELLKAVDVTEYYRAKALVNPPKTRDPAPSDNVIMEPNELLDDPSFDITKVSKLNVDGDERDIRIIS